MNKLITVLGPTACGKTALAVRVAKSLNGEIISADSRQIYRGMDIGTGKDLEEYDGVPYHLIDIQDAGYQYNLYEYQRDFNVAYKDILSRGVQPVLCGGTGLYIEAVLKGYNMPQVPENKALREELKGCSMEELKRRLFSYKDYKAHNVTDFDSAARAIRAIEIEEHYLRQGVECRVAEPIDSFIIGIDVDREIRRNRITTRLKKRLEGGMIDEVKALIDSGVEAERLIYYGLEYKFITQYLLGQYAYNQMVELLEIAIHQFAKRQMTWFRGMEKRGFKIHWIDGNCAIDEIYSNAIGLINKEL